MKSKTPRTDSNLISWNRYSGYFHDEKGTLVDAEFARELEREVLQLRQEIEAQKEEDRREASSERMRGVADLALGSNE